MASARQVRIENLDLLRLFAALAVVFFHYAFRGAAADGYTALSFPSLAPYAAYGYFGVDLFFIISGFVIAYSAQGRSAATFAAARISRLYPGFLAGMTLTFLVTLAFGAPRFETGLTHYLANLSMVAPALGQPFMDGAYWSIVLEITFYGWVALLLVTGLFFRRQKEIVLLWLMIGFLNQFGLESGVLKHLFITQYAGQFAVGIMLYRIHSGQRTIEDFAILTAAIVYATASALEFIGWFEGHYLVVHDPLIVAAITLGNVAIFAGALALPRLPLPARVIAALGGITYPLYLIHQHVGYIAFNRLAGAVPAPLLFVATALAVTIAALAIWSFVERPVMRPFRKALERLFARLPLPHAVRTERDLAVSPPLTARI